MIGDDEITPDYLRHLARDFKTHLEDSADVLEKLQNVGWETCLTTYEIACVKNIPDEEAKAELKNLGLDLDLEYPDDECDCEECVEEREKDGGDRPPVRIEVVEEDEYELGIDP